MRLFFGWVRITFKQISNALLAFNLEQNIFINLKHKHFFLNLINYQTNLVHGAMVPEVHVLFEHPRPHLGPRLPLRPLRRDQPVPQVDYLLIPLPDLRHLLLVLLVRRLLHRAGLERVAGQVYN